MGPASENFTKPDVLARLFLDRKCAPTADEMGTTPSRFPYDAEAAMATIAKSAMLCHLALRIVDPPDVAGGPLTPQ